ncbi:MAG: phosphoribosylanthranilate isomerase [Pirellula sp.]|nr:phosphoribosylanthranilate isomerase [Pirellula sp.]
MFRIKICGITNVEDAIAAVNAGADAIGLNFYEMSPRSTTVHRAHEISQAIADQPVDRVGVFVNSAAASIEAIVKEGALTSIQLHGDEPPEVVAHFAQPKRPQFFPFHFQVIRARRMDDRGVAAIAADLAACRGAGWGPASVLVDAATPGRYGGTGETVSWVGLADYPRWLGSTPLILAGGLTPDNVAEAIRIVRPAAVDVASGVESSPGKKDPHKVRDFVAAAQAAFESLES